MARRQRNTGNRYAIYCRCSNDDQAHGDYTTIDNQELKNQRHVLSKNAVVVKLYGDEGKTGTNLERPGFKQMLADARAGVFDRVCATYMSRIGRGNCFHVAEYLLNECGISIELAEENFSDDLNGSMTKDMTVLLDGLQPKMVSQHTKTKMHEMARKGSYCGGIVPFGYRSVYTREYDPRYDLDEPEKVLVIEEDEAEAVRGAFEEFRLKKTVASVREYLNGTTCRAWHTTSARNLLTNETYTGVYQWGEIRNEEHHPAIVDQEVFHEVQGILQASRKKHTRSARNDNYTYYLRGLVRCPHCGCNYTNSFAKGGQVYYYECHDKKKHPKINNCPVCRINSDALHVAVIDEIRRAAEHHTVMHSLIAQSKGWHTVDNSVRTLRGQLGKKKGQLDLHINNLLKVLGDGRGHDTILDRLNTLEQQKKQLLADMEVLDLEIQRSTVKRPTASMVQQVWSEMLELWDYATEEERAELMSLVVKDVVVQQKNSVNLHLNPMADFSEFKVRNNRISGSGGRI